MTKVALVCVMSEINEKIPKRKTRDFYLSKNNFRKLKISEDIRQFDYFCLEKQVFFIISDCKMHTEIPQTTLIQVALIL